MFFITISMDIFNDDTKFHDEKILTAFETHFNQYQQEQDRFVHLKSHHQKSARQLDGTDFLSLYRLDAIKICPYCSTLETTRREVPSVCPSTALIYRLNIATIETTLRKIVRYRCC